MPNIASVLKEEIARLARKEVRTETDQLRKTSAKLRADVAAQKRQIASLEQQVGRLLKARPAAVPNQEQTTAFRFSAKGLNTQRQRLGLSAAQMGTLLEVSAQTIYNWEAGKSRPRSAQMPAIGALRAMGKRDAATQLANRNK